MPLILGAHMSMAKGFPAAADRTHEELACNAMQVFLKSPRSSSSKPLSDENAQLFQAKCKEYGIEFVIGHASYLLNFAKPVDPKDPWPSNNLKDDLTKLGRLGGHGLVYHVGKQLKMERNEALNNLYTNLKDLLKTAEASNVPILLENASGQGTEIGLKLEELQEILEAMNWPDYLKVCLDTCHAFAAGYDLRDAKSVQAFFDQIEATIGLDTVTCFHFNDSKKELGSCRDRHANIGQGEIGAEGLQAFAKLAVKHSKPILLETPLVNDSHKDDIDIVKSWF